MLAHSLSFLAYACSLTGSLPGSEAYSVPRPHVPRVNATALGRHYIVGLTGLGLGI